MIRSKISWTFAASISPFEAMWNGEWALSFASFLNGVAFCFIRSMTFEVEMENLVRDLYKLSSTTLKSKDLRLAESSYKTLSFTEVNLALNIRTIRFSITLRHNMKVAVQQFEL